VERLAGRFVVVPELPKGAVCLNAYPVEKQERETWNPTPQWRGEKSYHPNRELQSDEHRQWYHFDAEGKVLGHLAQAIATVLRGKDSPLYDPIRDVGAFAVVTNCEKVRVSGKKYHYKLYFRNLSYRPGHTKLERFKDLQRRFPERIIMRAVWGSMPRTPSCRRIFKERLKLFKGPNHLYYHKDPVEYPMHMIKDCTPTQSLRKKDRIGYYLKKLAPQSAKKIAEQEAIDDRKRLNKFRKFLLKQFDEEGEDALERMEMDEFVVHAEEERIKQVLDENVGQKVKKKEVKMLLGTSIPKKRISGNRPRR